MKDQKRQFHPSERVYRDMEGNPTTLDALCWAEPEWAANQIRKRDELESRVAKGMKLAQELIDREEANAISGVGGSLEIHGIGLVLRRIMEGGER